MNTKKLNIKNLIFTIIRIVLVIALVFAIFFFVFKKPAKSDKPFIEIKNAITKMIETENMEENTVRFLKKYYNLNAGDFDGVLIYTPTTSMDAEEILLIKLKDDSQEDAIKKAVEERVDAKLQAFKGYAPEQYDLSKKYILDISGGYALYVVGPDAQKIDEAFKKAL